jgi:DNA-binding response OmpR family regulator
MRILIADDDPLMRIRLQKILTGAGYEVTAANDGDQADQELDQGSFDCLVTDWMMPGFDGPEVISRHRTRSSDRYTYCILLTMMGESDSYAQGMEAGADDFLTKPLNKTELLVRLQVASRITQLQNDLADRNAALSLALGVLDVSGHGVKA